MNKIIARKLRSSNTNKLANNVFISKEDGTLERFEWNKYYHVYNSSDNYHQLTSDELKNIDWDWE